MKALDIAKPINVVLDSQIKTDTVQKINDTLLQGFNTYEIPISYELLDFVKIFYSSDWHVTSKEYKANIKLTFKPKKNLVEIE